LPSFMQQPGLLEDADMLGHRRPADAKVASDVAGTLLAAAEQVKDRAAAPSVRGRDAVGRVSFVTIWLH
jgi:hypothetical protein